MTVTTTTFEPAVISTLDYKRLYRQLNRSIRLLLVEDNPSDVMLLQYGLDEAQSTYSLQVAVDGEEAARTLERISAAGNGERPDLIFLDLNLPKRDGHELLAIIKTDPRLSSIPVVILSSSEAPSDVLSAYRNGANTYLSKPRSLEDMLDMMRTIEHYWGRFALLPSVA